jgi:hypothetical protein
MGCCSAPYLELVSNTGKAGLDRIRPASVFRPACLSALSMCAKEQGQLAQAGKKQRRNNGGADDELQ